MLLLPLLLSCINSTNPNSQLLRPCALVLSIRMQDLGRNPFALGQPKLNLDGLAVLICAIFS